MTRWIAGDHDLHAQHPDLVAELIHDATGPGLFSMMTRLLAIMGSGETAPTMVKPHRQLFERLGPDPVPAVILDTPYGFQANADDISARAVELLRRQRGADRSRPSTCGGSRARIRCAPRRRWPGWRRPGGCSPGPGSPTYALRQWAGTDVPGPAGRQAGARTVAWCSPAPPP